MRWANNNDQVWAAGNVVNPMANIPIAAGAGLGAALAAEDFDAAIAATSAL